ncbi:glycosyltransferase family 4 protein [Pontiellaceae bacterium B12227]|nr:glycosyltransferase family 4 protein [Pontiellaceae bacterium B12227]
MVNKFLYPRAGAETYMLYVSEQLQKAGHEIAFFGMEHPENTTLGPCTTFPLLEFGPTQSTVDKLANIASAARQSLNGTVPRALREAIDAFQPDLLHAHNVYNQMSPGLFRPYMDRFPILMTIHDFKPICPNYSLFRDGSTCTLCVEGSVFNCVRHRCSQGRLSSSVLAAASAGIHRSRNTYQKGYHGFIAPSGFMLERMVQGGIPADRIEVINNFAAAPDHVTPPGTGFLFAGRLCAEKGVDTLIEAYALLEKPRPPLTIAGTGPTEKQLKARAAELGCDEINWTGRVAPEKVESMLEQSAYSIIPSLWFENCSIAIMESLAHGRPCIVSGNGGNPELIRDREDGWVFEAGHAHQLAECMREAHTLVPETREKMGAAAARIARKRFSPSVHLEQLMSVYEKGIAEHGRP